MSVIILNAERVVFKDPTKPTAHVHHWWAEGGLVLWHDQVTGEFGSQTVFETLQRLKGLNDMIGNNRTGRGWNMPSEMAEYRRYIDGMIRVCQTAKQQGMPDDAAHSRQMVAEVKARRQSRMVVPGLSGRAAARW